MSKKLLVLLSLILAVAMVFTACATPADEEAPPTEDADTSSEDTEDTDDDTEDTDTADTGEKILKSNNSSEPGSLDPALAQGTHESWVLENVFEGLMTFDEKGELVPGMAESYEISWDKGSDPLSHFIMIRRYI